jgi:hypothetical protein
MDETYQEKLSGLGGRTMANCREYCKYREICKEKYPKYQGEEKLSPSDCPMAWRIEDTMDESERWEE